MVHNQDFFRVRPVAGILGQRYVCEPTKYPQRTRRADFVAIAN